MSSAEKFCLRWNDFESNISTAFKQLREDKDFFDVTLACEDEQLEAHKVILAACSPFFRSILKRNRHEHPLLYLKGIKYTDLVAVLNFMYHGEVNVAQEDLDVFLALAQDLQIKGLTQKDEEQKKGKEVSTREPSPPPNPKIRKPPDLSDTSTPQKRIQITKSMQPIQPKQELVHYVEDDIQDVTPVKREPGTALHDPVLSQSASQNYNQAASNGNYSQAASNIVYNEAHSNQIVDSSLDNSMFDDSYNDYGNYDEGGETNFTESISADNPDENKGSVFKYCYYAVALHNNTLWVQGS